MTNYNFDEIWNECLSFNIEQKPEEYKGLLDLLASKSNKGYALEIGSNYGGTTAGFCRLFKKVITIDIKHHENFDKLKDKYSGYSYIISDSKSNDTLDYIRRLGIKFDFIFIDGDHSYEGVKSDYDKYKQFLAHDGFVAFHDILYTQENVSDNTRVDALWNEIKGSYKEKYEFVSSVKSEKYSTDNLFYSIIKNRPYPSWGGIGVLRNFQVSVFSHNYLCSKNDWHRIVFSQLTKLVESGLYKRADKIFYGVNAENDLDYGFFCKTVSLFDADKKIEVCRYERNLYEYSTLIHLQNHSFDNPTGLVLYYHAKGSSRPYNRNIESWRDCLDYFNIERWKLSFDVLMKEECDVSGALYINRFEFLDKVLEYYYSGNFWWSTTKYITTLPNLSKTGTELGFARDYPEMWIGKSGHVWRNLHHEDASDWYFHYFDPNKYRQ